MAMGRRFELMAMALVTLASLVGLISAAMLDDYVQISGVVERIRDRLIESEEWTPETITGIGRRFYDAVENMQAASGLKQMVDDEECNHTVDTHLMLLHILNLRPRRVDRPVRLLVNHVSKVHLQRCGKKYEEKLASAFRDSSEGKPDGLLTVLSDDFIEGFYRVNPNYSRELIHKVTRADLLKASRSLIHDMRLGGNDIRRRSGDCQVYVSALKQTIKFIRLLIDLIHGTELDAYSDIFKRHLFRYKFCVDVQKTDRGTLDYILSEDYNPS